jgi:hypothetical protein
LEKYRRGVKYDRGTTRFFLMVDVFAPAMDFESITMIHELIPIPSFLLLLLLFLLSATVEGTSIP